MTRTKWTWLALTISSGTLFAVSSCASDLGYSVLSTLVDYLPTWLESLQTTTTT